MFFSLKRRCDLPLDFLSYTLMAKHKLLTKKAMSNRTYQSENSNEKIGTFFLFLKAFFFCCRCCWVQGVMQEGGQQELRFRKGLTRQQLCLHVCLFGELNFSLSFFLRVLCTYIFVVVAAFVPVNPLMFHLLRERNFQEHSKKLSTSKSHKTNLQRNLLMRSIWRRKTTTS